MYNSIYIYIYIYIYIWHNAKSTGNLRGGMTGEGRSGFGKARNLLGDVIAKAKGGQV